MSSRIACLIRAALLGVLFVAVATLVPVSASAAEGPAWRIIAVSNPTNFKPAEPGGESSGAIVVIAVNVGGASTNGSSVTVSDALPTGLTATGISGVDSYRKPFTLDSEESNMSCSSAPALGCTESGPVAPGDTLIVNIPVSMGPGLPPSVTNVASVSGGGAPGASASTPVAITAQAPPYGVAPDGLMAATSTLQAGAHPNVTVAFFLNTVNRGTGLDKVEPVGGPKDISFDLPPGLVGNTVGVPRCVMANVADFSDCPRDTMVGTSTTIISRGRGAGTPRWSVTVPVFNIAPAPGEPAAFGFNSVLFPVRLDTSVLSDGDYGVRVSGA